MPKDVAMTASEISLSFDCSRCDEEVVIEDLDLPDYFREAESISESVGYETVTTHCRTCKKAYSITITNQLGDITAQVDRAADILVYLHGLDDLGLNDFDYTEYLHGYIPDEPKEAFSHSMAQLDDLVARLKPLDGDKTFYRMLFVQYMVLMEAYLCDRLITLAAGIPEVFKALVTQHHAFKDRKFTVQAVVSNPNLILDKTIYSLKRMLYHDLEMVDKLFKAALGDTPFCDDSNKEFLKAAAVKRHHCVHRNGKDTDGMMLKDIDKQYVSNVSSHIFALVANVENKFENYIEVINPKDLPF